MDNREETFCCDNNLNQTVNKEDSIEIQEFKKSHNFINLISPKDSKTNEIYKSEPIIFKKIHKLKIILDLDETLISSTDSLNQSPGDYFNFDVLIAGRKRKMSLQIRKGVKQFLSLLNESCEFYVVTNAIQPYAIEVVNILNNYGKYFFLLSKY